MFEKLELKKCNKEADIFMCFLHNDPFKRNYAFIFAFEMIILISSW
jgi:hypothetical protein